MPTSENGEPGFGADVPDEHRSALNLYFDRDFYLAANPDIVRAKVDPLEHFLTKGWREGRNPSRSFDVSYYLASNADVAAAGVNPLLHYVWAGAKEGRKPTRPVDPWRRQLDTRYPRRQRAAQWSGVADGTVPLTLDMLTDALGGASAGAGMIVSVSHDDFAANFGGVQNVIRNEQRAFRQAGWHYLHVSPAAPLPMLADPGPPGRFRVVVRLDHARLGVVRLSDLVTAITGLRAAIMAKHIVVHHLLGYAPELVLDLVRACGADPPIAWVHDFFAVCRTTP